MSETSASRSAPESMVGVLSVMMFLQFFTWGAWFATLADALVTNQLGDIVGDAYATAPIAAIVAPLFLGLIADRFFSSEKVMGVLLLLGGVCLMAIPPLQAQGAPAKTVVWLVLAHMLCYMPTLGLSNTIAFTHIPNQDQFPKIRVWGTIGWIIAGLTVGGLGWSSTYNIFWLGAFSSIVLGVYCFFLPSTPPPLRDEPMDLRSLFMVDAWKLLGDWNFCVFAICSTLICIPLAYYYGQTSTFLSQTGFAQSASTMTIGQMSEIVFMLLIPFFFRKLGIKLMILIGMACWSLRYVLFAFGAADQVTWMLLLAIALHGICYDFFFVTGFMYTDQTAPKEIRGQAQGLLVFLTQGVGMFLGYKVMAGGEFLGIPLGLTIGPYGKQVTNSKEYVEALKTARGEVEPVGFFESFGQMFSRHLPESLDPNLLQATMEQWKDFWLLPAILAGLVFMAFAAMFWQPAPGLQDEAS